MSNCWLLVFGLDDFPVVPGYLGFSAQSEVLGGLFPCCVTYTDGLSRFLIVPAFHGTCDGFVGHNGLISLARLVWIGLVFLRLLRLLVKNRDWSFWTVLTFY
ncbi:hypothetical protein TNCV_3899721 [Trichonephila clavipes]|nr:hypothetical protein TNCV_3899721 [Trichonephila clavipes]